ncbi:hypothetical protein FQN49_005781 [Arthroderma sp. PD_2]|nr:hypothetical protein FQN49_005781 [Arthroderma sp. PD_2]
MAAPQHLTGDKLAIQAFVDRFDAFLFDCDGVLWSGDTPFKGAVETLDMLRNKGKEIVFVTNNSTKSRVDYKKKLDGLGIKAQIEEIFSSSYSASVYISRILELPPNKRKVFILGESGIEQELAAENVSYIGGTDPAYRRDITPQDFEKIASGDLSMMDPEVGVVLVGLDYHINYLKLAVALHYIRRGAVFLATNIDSTLPSAGSLFPGGGSICAPLVGMLGGPAVPGAEPLSLGKPSQVMMDAIEGKFKFDRKKTCMVGDRIDTDIKFGISGGLGGTLAVLTGVTSREQLLASPEAPAAYVDALSDLLEGA